MDDNSSSSKAVDRIVKREAEFWKIKPGEECEDCGAPAVKRCRGEYPGEEVAACQECIDKADKAREELGL